LIKTAHQHLLLLVGFDTLIYRKYYDTPPILVGHHGGSVGTEGGVLGNMRKDISSTEKAEEERIEGTRLIKSDITRNAHPIANRVPTLIALMLITVSKKNTLNRLSGQFGAFTMGKKNIANATKQTKRRVIRSTTRKALERNTTLQSSRGLNIDEIGDSGNSLSPKAR
jgi:hypothetical protein